jgi:hypothetical protein
VSSAGGCSAGASSVGCVAIEKLDRVGFQLDGGRFDNVLERRFAVRDFEGLVVLPGEVFALREDLGAFDQTVCQFSKCFPVAHYVVPLGAFLPVVGVFVFPRSLGRNGELGGRHPVLELSDFCLSAGKAEDCLLI